VSHIAHGSKNPQAIVGVGETNPFRRSEVMARMFVLEVLTEYDSWYKLQFKEVTHERHLACVGEDPLRSTKSCLMIFLAVVVFLFLLVVVVVVVVVVLFFGFCLFLSIHQLLRYGKAIYSLWEEVIRYWRSVKLPYVTKEPRGAGKVGRSRSHLLLHHQRQRTPARFSIIACGTPS